MVPRRDALTLLALVRGRGEPSLRLAPGRGTPPSGPEEQIASPIEEEDGDDGRQGEADRRRIAEPVVMYDPVFDPQAHPAGEAHDDRKPTRPMKMPARDPAGRYAPKRRAPRAARPVARPHDQAEDDVAGDAGRGR